jgi:hypothetical protein
MVTRVAIVVLWTVAIGWAFNYVSPLFGASSSILLLLLAGGVSAFVAAARWFPFWQVRNAEAAPTPVVATSAHRSVRSSF